MRPIPSLPLAVALLAVGAVAQREFPQKPVAPVEKTNPAPNPVAPTDSAAKPADPKPLPGQAEAGAPVADPRAKLRTVVRMLIQVERAHRDRAARLERLRVLFTDGGATEKLATVARLAELEGTRYRRTLDGYARDLGPDLYAKVRAVLDAGSAPGDVPAAPVDPTTARPKVR